MDKEEIMILTGKLPEDISEVLRNPSTVRYWRPAEFKKIIGVISNK